MKATDVVIIGVGIIGSSTAYFLTKAGLNVTLIDSQGLISSGTASPACSGGVRIQGRLLAEIPLSIYAVKLWANLEEELDAILHYCQDGQTVVTDDEAKIPFLKERVTKEQSLGLDIQMVQSPELQDLIPGLSRRFLAGSYCKSDGHADPMQTTYALARAACRLGASFKEKCTAQNFVVEKRKIEAVRTTLGAIPCRHAVLAAGAWSKEIAATVGIDLPIYSRTLQSMITFRRPHVMDQVLAWVGHGISLKQVPSGGFVIGGGWPGHGGLDYHTRMDPGSMAKNTLEAIELFPSIADVPLLRAWGGIEAFCVDKLPIIGPVPDLDGLILATGFTGHGFAISPGVGSLLAKYVTSGTLPEMLKPFSIRRFDSRPEEFR